ncbi:unnamed protein product [Malus baccata var. baccata]
MATNCASFSCFPAHLRRLSSSAFCILWIPAILGGAAGAVTLVGISIILIWFCISCNMNVSRTSETGSSGSGRKFESVFFVPYQLFLLMNLIDSCERYTSC